MRQGSFVRGAVAAVACLVSVGCRDTAYWSDLLPDEKHADGGRFKGYVNEVVNPVMSPRDFRPCALADLRAAPRRWKDKDLVLEVIFSATHEGSIAFFTRHTKSAYQGFSAWDPEVRLWVPPERNAAEYAHLFMSKTLAALDDLEALAPYQAVRIYGKGSDLFDAFLCVDVDRIEVLPGPYYTEESLLALRAGDEAWARSDWPAAREAYRRAAAVPIPRAGMLAAYRGWGFSAEKVADWAEVAEALDAALLIEPEDLATAWGAGRGHLVLGRWDTAADRFATCEKVLATRGDAARLGEDPVRPADRRAMRLGLATAQTQRGRFAEARPLFESLLADGAHDGAVLNNYADMLLREGKDAKQALVLARRAADALGDGVQVSHTLGWACLVNGDGANAVIHLARAHAGDPADAEIALHYGEALFRTGQPVYAKALLEKVVQSGGDIAAAARALIQEIDASEKALFAPPRE